MEPNIAACRVYFRPNSLTIKLGTILDYNIKTKDNQPYSSTRAENTDIYIRSLIIRVPNKSNIRHYHIRLKPIYERIVHNDTCQKSQQDPYFPTVRVGQKHVVLHKYKKFHLWVLDFAQNSEIWKYAHMYLSTPLYCKICLMYRIAQIIVKWYSTNYYGVFSVNNLSKLGIN
jgi:hypothetical protein